MELYVELPSLPSYFESSRYRGNRPHVIAHLIEGQDHTARFIGFNIAEHALVMEGLDEVLTSIPLSHLRYLEFIEHLHYDPTVGEKLPLPEEYRILFRDSQSLKGKTFSHKIDEYGLHIFSTVSPLKMAWLFAPIDSITDYSFGSSINESVTQKSKTSSSYDANGLCENKQALIDSLNQYSNYLDFEEGEFSNRRIGEILVGKNIISPLVLADALKLQQQQPRRKLGTILESMGQITTDQINQKLAEKLGIPLVSLKHFSIEVETLNSVPHDFCKRYHLLPLFYHKDHLVIALDDPLNFEALDVVRFATGKIVDGVLALHGELADAIDKLYGHEHDIDDGLTMAEADAKLYDLDKVSIKDAELLAKDNPVVRLVGGILRDAVQKRASDVHIRPLNNSVQLLYRIDGSLVPIRTFSRSLLPAIISRIKVLGRMDVAERRRPQGGRARISEGGALVDLRISVIPTIVGESAVVRLLNTNIGLRSIDELGLCEDDQEVLVELLHKNCGMFLVTGPTGSGKSTTLYAALQNIKSQNVNVITVEDPVEYQISGIEQIQVQSNFGYTFAESLRHILRHDPDVIMVGEIRDGETAKIAVESALTGHLVLSTLHTNSAAGTVTRLLEMGVEPYLVSSTLLGVLAQRLVKINCPHCLDVEPVNRIIRRSLSVAEDEVFYKGKGCEKCNETGYSGRMAVYELLNIGREIRSMIENSKSTDAISQCAIDGGMITLTNNALQHARERKTSLEEVYRVRLD